MTAQQSPPAPLTATDAETEKTWWYEEGGKFWVPNDQGDWVSLPDRSFNLWLQEKQRLSAKPLSADQPISPMEKEFLYTQANRRVTYAGPLAGYKMGVQKMGDSYCLVTRSTELIEPVPGEFPVITAFLHGLFQTGPDEVEPQTGYFLGWHQQAMRALYRGRPSKGMALVFAGSAGCGKTLLKDLLQLTMGKRECKPYPYMTGKTNFNKDLIESCLWSIDDEAASTRPEDRVKFGAALKIAVANTEIRIEAKHANAGSINSFRRIVICVNDEPDRLLVLPALDDDIADKIMILHCSRGPDIMPTDTEDQKEAFWQAMVDELPHYLHYLLNEYELGDDMHGRFGVKHYHNPEIYEQLAEISPERETERVIQKGLFGQRPSCESTEWETIDSIVNMLTDDESGLTNREKDRLPAPAWVAKRLSKLSKHRPKYYLHKRTAKCNLWKIYNLEHTPTEIDETAIFDED